MASHKKTTISQREFTKCWHYLETAKNLQPTIPLLMHRSMLIKSSTLPCPPLPIFNFPHKIWWYSTYAHVSISRKDCTNSQNYTARACGHYYKSSDCFEYPKRSYLNQATQTILAKFVYPKKCQNWTFQAKKFLQSSPHLKTRVPLCLFAWEYRWAIWTLLGWGGEFESQIWKVI